MPSYSNLIARYEGKLGSNYTMESTYISPNIKKESVRIDPSGNIINPQNKQILQKNEPEFIPPPELVQEASQKAPEASQSVVPAQDKEIPIIDLIAETEAKLEELKLLKQKKIQEMKAELERLEK